MEYYGLSYEIPNAFGSYLANILEPFHASDYFWTIFSDEIYLLDDEDGITNEFLFHESETDGKRLYELASSNRYYMIFVTLMAFKREEDIHIIRTYKDFRHSDCELAISVADTSYVMIWSKNSKLITKAYDYAVAEGYENVEYMSDDFLINNCYME